MDASPVLTPFPESQRVVFGRNPLVEVICQLRFPTILDIGSRAPAEFQEDIRAEYPLYERDADEGIPAEIAQVLSRLPAGRPEEDATHKFVSADSKRVVSLNRGFVAVATTDYDRWELFKAEINRAKIALEQRYHPAFYSRIGLRYRDVIDRMQLGMGSVSWSDLVRSDVAGVLGSEIQERVIRQRTETVVRLADVVPGGQALLRHGLADGESGQVYLIDADFSTEERNSSDDVFGVLDEFNRLAGDLFRWAITPRLHNALDPGSAQ